MKENLIRNSYLNSFNINDKGLQYLIIINTKCLVDDKIQRYVYIDNNRLKDELRYYNFYGTRPSYDDILNILLPLILANVNIQKSEDEVVNLTQKYVKYFKKEDNLFEYILGAVIYNALIHYLLENKNIEYGDSLSFLDENDDSHKIILQNKRLVITPGHHILYHDIDSVYFENTNGFIKINLMSNNKEYQFIVGSDYEKKEE